jgi:hypothetical protein
MCVPLQGELILQLFAWELAVQKNRLGQVDRGNKIDSTEADKKKKKKKKRQ